LLRRNGNRFEIIMDVVSAEHFLLDQFPLRLRPTIPTTLKTAYAAAGLLISQEPILQVKSADDNRGRVVQWAVDLAVERLINTGQWPFKFEWKKFFKPTGHYLEVRLSHSVLTISQVSDPTKQPRNVVFRENARLTNEPFFDLDEFRSETEFHGLPHFLLVHGHQELTFAHLAVPHSQHHRDYIYRTSNLMNMPHEVPQEEPPVEETELELVMRLKDEIEKRMKENGE
jgi:hypothetical protein